MAERTLRVVITGDASDADRALKQIQGAAEKTAKKFDSLATRMSRAAMRTGKAMTTYVTLPLVGGAILATKAAAEEEQQMALLANTIRQTLVGATDDQIQANEDWITSMQNATGVADGDLRDAMRHLLIAGMDLEESQKNLTIAMDIAAAKGLDLEAVTNAIAKASRGNVGALGRLGLQVRTATGDMLSFDTIMGNAARTMSGAAAEAADTASGRIAIATAKFLDLAEQIGTILIPVLEKLTEWFGKIVDWFQKLTPEQQKQVVMFGAIAAAIGPLLIIFAKLITAFGAIASAAKAMYAVVLAHPWVLIGLAIAALVILVIEKWDKIKAVIVGAWQTIMDKTKAARDFIKGIFDELRDIWNAIPGWVKAPLIGLMAPIIAPFAAAFAIIKAGIAGLRAAWMSLMDLINQGVPKGVGPVIPKGPIAPPPGVQFAGMGRGGIVHARPGGFKANLAESGSAEAVIPLNQQGIGVMRAAFAGIGAGATIVNLQVGPRVMEEIYVGGKAAAERKGRG